uniref:Uncharacterized protein n=1 Tax=Amphiprion ocellaris TaxID=80972 RepID=A0AAQ5XBY6_AMPOC
MPVQTYFCFQAKLKLSEYSADHSVFGSYHSVALPAKPQYSPGSKTQKSYLKDNGIDTRRECILKGLCVYLNEDPDKLVKEYKADDENTAAAMAETVYGIYIIRHSGAEPSDAPEDVGIILEGVTVLSELRNVPFALSILLAYVYNLDLSYPPELKYTFEALQKIILKLDGNRLSAKVQALKTVLSH